MSTSTQKMDPRIKALWLERLRDPATKQAKGTLNRVQSPNPEKLTEENRGRFTVGQCCLGVLCEIAVAEGITTSTLDHRGGGEVTTLYADTYISDDDQWPTSEGGVLPHVVCDWSGLPDTSPFVNAPNGQGRQTLATLNDRGLTFPEIADLIDANF